MRLNTLDIARFLAALSVVLYHYIGRNEFALLREVTKFGYLGVPFFFMISGYVISISASNRSSIEFAISRFIRLYPALWVGIGFTILVTTYLGQGDYSLGQILANLTLCNDYLGYKDIDGVYWTLQAELKFYGCIFLLILFGLFDKIRVWLSIWLAITALYLLIGQPFFMGWFISPNYSSFFIAGVACYLIQKEGANRFNLFILFASLVISAFRGIEQSTDFMKDIGVVSQSIAVLLTCLLYLLFYMLVTEKIRISGNRYYLILGGLTYPLYLIHNMAGKAVLERLQVTVPATAALLLTIALILFSAYLIHIGVEKRVATPMKIWLLNVVNYFPSLKGKRK